MSDYRLTAVVLYLLASAAMTLFTSSLRFDRDARSCLAAMVNGTAHRPFVMRRLVPDTIGLLTRCTPAPWRGATVQAIEALPPPLPRLLLGHNSQAAYAHLLLVLSVWGCYCGTLLCWRWLLRTGSGLSAGRSLWLPVLALGLVYPLLNWRHGVHIYDPATLFLYSLALVVMVKAVERAGGRGFAQAVVLTALAAWHKETAVLLIVWWALVWRHAGQSSYAGLFLQMMGLVSLYLGIRLWLGWLYRGNPGSAFEFWLLKFNLPFLESMVTDFGGRHLRFLLILAIAIALPAWGWRRKPLLLRQMMLTGLLVLGVPWLFWGILDEFRALLELYPLWVMLCVPAGYSLPSSTAVAPSGTLNRR